MVSLQIVPAVYKGTTLSPEKQIMEADVFSGSRCVHWYGLVAGNCDIPTPPTEKVENGILLPADVYPGGGSGYIVGGVPITGFNVEHDAYDAVHPQYDLCQIGRASY